MLCDQTAADRPLPAPRTSGRCAGSAATRRRAPSAGRAPRPKALRPNVEQSLIGIGRQAIARRLQELLERLMDETAAFGGGRIGIERIERLEIQDMPGVDGIGIANPGLDLRHRQAGRAQRPPVGAAPARLIGATRPTSIELALPAEPDAGMQRLRRNLQKRAAGCRSAAASARARWASPRPAAPGSASAPARSTRPGRNHGRPCRCAARAR